MEIIQPILLRSCGSTLAHIRPPSGQVMPWWRVTYWSLYPLLPLGAMWAILAPRPSLYLAYRISYDIYIYMIINDYNHHPCVTMHDESIQKEPQSSSWTAKWKAIFFPPLHCQTGCNVLLAAVIFHAGKTRRNVRQYLSSPQRGQYLFLSFFFPVAPFSFYAFFMTLFFLFLLFECSCLLYARKVGLLFFQVWFCGFAIVHRSLARTIETNFQEKTAFSHSCVWVVRFALAASCLGSSSRARTLTG